MCIDIKIFKCLVSNETYILNKRVLYNNPPPLLNLKLLRPLGQINDVKYKKSQEIGHIDFFSRYQTCPRNGH